MDGVEHPQSRTPHVVTEINFGLHAGSGRLVRHGRPGRSMYL